MTTLHCEQLTAEELAVLADEAFARYARMVGDDLSDEEARRSRRPLRRAATAHKPR